MDDARAPADGEMIETDVCIVGAGPAGLALARSLAGTSKRVLVLESGGTSADAAGDALNDGDCVGDPYAGLVATRHRQIGGSAALWNTRTPNGAGAKFTPLDPVDFETREAVAHSGWPLSFEDVMPWYRRASDTLGFGALRFGADDWSTTGRTPLDSLSEHVTTGVYRFGARDDLLGPMLRAVRSAGNVRLMPRATAIGLECDRQRRRLARVRVATSEGTCSVVARTCVLCAGAIENARLLLCAAAESGGLGGISEWLGRGFMEHPRDASLVFEPASAATYRRLSFYDLFVAEDGALVLGRLALRNATIRQAGLLNASATLLPVLRAGVPAIRRAAGRLGRRGPLDRLLPRGGHGWSSQVAPGAVFSRLRVLINLEQAPQADNRIVLSARRDAFGVPRAELHWRWSERDEASRRQVRELFADALDRTGLGAVRRTDASLDPNAHHHAGTTRMHRDPRLGVVDEHCRVHGLENVYAGGGSVFPTAGFANPVFTIVALALRLGEHLRSVD